MDEDSSVLLEKVVSRFNEELRLWYKTSGHGANFRFTYEPESGLKFLEVSDVAPVDPKKPTRTDDPRVLMAHGILHEALKEVIHGESGSD